MKRFASIALVALILVAISVAALAASGSVTVSTANEWKTCIGYTVRTASGSFWKATCTAAGTNGTSSTAYLYKQGGDRCTHQEPFTKGTERTGLNYLSGQAVTGASYKLNCTGPKTGTYSYTFNP